MQVAIRELKSHFSKYLRKVQTGEDIIITTHGKPIARFSPLDKYDIITENSLQDVSWIRKGDGGKAKGLSDKQRITLSSRNNSEKNLSDIVLEDRE